MFLSPLGNKVDKALLQQAQLSTLKKFLLNFPQYFVLSADSQKVELKNVPVGGGGADATGSPTASKRARLSCSADPRPVLVAAASAAPSTSANPAAANSSPAPLARPHSHPSSNAPSPAGYKKGDLAKEAKEREKQLKISQHARGLVEAREAVQRGGYDWLTCLDIEVRGARMGMGADDDNGDEDGEGEDDEDDGKMGMKMVAKDEKARGAKSTRTAHTTAQHSTGAGRVIIIIIKKQQQAWERNSARMLEIGISSYSLKQRR
jgi:hypothetical protein